MTIFEKLEEVTMRQAESDVYPVWLVDPVLQVARCPERYTGKEYLVEILVAQVDEYDPYAESGCCKWAFDHEDIKRTLRWLED